MPEQLFSLRAADPDGDQGLRDNMIHPPGVDHDAGPVSRATFLDGNGEAVGDAIDVRHFATVHLEHPGEDGTFGASKVTVPPVFVADPSDQAASLAIATPEGFVAQILLTDLPSHPASLPAPQVVTIGPADGHFVFPVISERFEHLADFLTKVRELRDFIVHKPPFNDRQIGDRFALRALFWPSHPDKGLFDTDDAKCKDRVFCGDRGVARTLLDPFIDRSRASLILINSGVRGGAGGTPGFSAWTSIKAEPGEDWRAVALHEIGHALGLGDEYLDAGRDKETPAVLEPNVSRAARADQAPWNDRITVEGALAPSHPAGAQDGTFAGVIGTFQGARYRNDLFRAMAHCLMRETTSDFCTICQGHIRTVFGK